VNFSLIPIYPKTLSAIPDSETAHLKMKMLWQFHFDASEARHGQ